MCDLTKDEVARYSRQLLMNEVGKEGQLMLKSTSVLIVGCGGLGCPCSIYLSAAGIGKIGLVDHDVVDKSNLHRQILHTESRIGTSKAESVKKALNDINSNTEIIVHDIKFNQSNAIDIVKDYDIIVDATDNAPTRYLINDASVLTGKPLISGAALRWEGQLTIYHYDENSPCYRCLFPSPPPPGAVTNCSDGGVLGVIPGIIGSFQALEVIKIALGQKPAYVNKMLLFDGLSGSFRTVQIRGRRADCAVCGKNPVIGTDLIDYEAFCGTPMCDDGKCLTILSPNERVTCQQYKENILEANVPHLLIDVRSYMHTRIVMLDNAYKFPLDSILNGTAAGEIEELITSSSRNINKVFFICRRGNASQKACQYMKENCKDIKGVEFKDIIGGITAWAKEIDPNMPSY